MADILDTMVMHFLGRIESWLMHRLSILLHTKWNGQKLITAQTHLHQLRVLYKSENFLAVNKHADIVMNNEAGDDRLSLYDQIRHKFPSLYQPELGHGYYVLHRLDYSTSGVVVVPLNKRAVKHASRQFEERRTKKYYLALVRGHMRDDMVDINIPIGKHSQLHHRMATPDDECCLKPRDARTRALVLQRGEFRGRPVTKVLLAPVTGRRHQLRIHCHRMGHTIVGDWTYSEKRDVLPPRMYLHAHRIVFTTALEPLDISAGDPFTPGEEGAGWCPGTEPATHSLETGYTAIHDDSLAWAAVTCGNPIIVGPAECQGTWARKPLD